MPRDLAAVEHTKVGPLLEGFYTHHGSMNAGKCAAKTCRLCQSPPTLFDLQSHEIGCANTINSLEWHGPFSAATAAAAAPPSTDDAPPTFFVRPAAASNAAFIASFNHNFRDPTDCRIVIGAGRSMVDNALPPSIELTRAAQLQAWKKADE